jgi:hypothetical protein
MTTTAYCLVAVSTLVLFLLGCLVIERRERDDADRTRFEIRQSVDYWEAEVDSWLAQLAEIRNLVTLPDGGDPPSTSPAATGVVAAHAEGVDPVSSATARPVRRRGMPAPA